MLINNCTILNIKRNTFIHKILLNILFILKKERNFKSLCKQKQYNKKTAIYPQFIFSFFLIFFHFIINKIYIFKYYLFLFSIIFFFLLFSSYNIINMLFLLKKKKKNVCTSMIYKSNYFVLFICLLYF